MIAAALDAAVPDPLAITVIVVVFIIPIVAVLGNQFDPHVI